MKKSLFLILLLATPTIWAQTPKALVDNHIASGNEKTQNEQLTAAEKDYRQALALNPKRTEALYNLGNNHYQGNHFEEAAQQYFLTQKNTSSKNEKHQAFHNMGNVHMQQKDYAKAVEAYKNALRNNPADEETRYNYALAKELLEKEKQEQQQDPQNQNQDQDQNQDQEQDQDDNKEQQNKGDQSKDNSDKKEEGDQEDDKSDQGNPEEKEGEEPKSPKNDQQQPPKENKQPPKPQKGQLSPEQIKSLLEAMNNQEKKVQDKVNAEKVKGVPVKGKKDW
ncbi:MAG: tetratricopeptide repeat protein [Flavobacteriaceae bacterium]